MFHSFRTSIVRSGRLYMSTGKTYKNILTETRGKVGVITLNRPKALNALCNELLAEVIEAGRDFDKDANIGCIVLTGTLPLLYTIYGRFRLSIFIFFYCFYFRL